MMATAPSSGATAAVAPALVAGRRKLAGVLAVTCGAGLLGPWIGGAWCVAGLGGVVAAALWAAPEPR